MSDVRGADRGGVDRGNPRLEESFADRLIGAQLGRLHGGTDTPAQRPAERPGQSRNRYATGIKEEVNQAAAERVASREPRSQPRGQFTAGGERVSSGTVWEGLAGFSRAVRLGDQIQVAGTTATHSDGCAAACAVAAWAADS